MQPQFTEFTSPHRLLTIILNRFKTWTPENVRTIGVRTFSGLCLSHMKNAAGHSPGPTLSQPLENLWSVQGRGGGGGGYLYRVCLRQDIIISDAEIYSTLILPSALITKSSLDISIHVFYVSDTSFSSWDICVLLPFSVLCLLHVRNIVNTPTHT